MPFNVCITDLLEKKKQKNKKRRTSNKMNAKFCRQILMFKGVLKGLLSTDERELHKRY